MLTPSKKHLTLTALTLSSAATAAPSPDPMLTIGVLGSYTEYRFTGGRSSDTNHFPEGGLFLNFGNKLTAHEGFIYEADLSGQYAKNGAERTKDGLAELDIGWQVPLDERNSVSLIAGGGYRWSRFEPDRDARLTNRLPFGKVGAGYNHRFDGATARLEVGVRRTVGGDARLNVQGGLNEKVDTRDSTSPYAELSVMFNQNGDMPIFAALFYNRLNVRLDGEFVQTSHDKQTRDEYGARIGLMF